MHRNIPSPPIYDPNEHQRRCPVCGARDRWRRVFSIGGGWTCRCRGGFDAEDIHHATLGHVCGPVCALGGAA
jgi:hypothetical protein